MNSKKRFLWIAIIILSIQAVKAFDEWILAGEVIDFDDTLFTTSINQRWDIATISFDDEVLLIGEGECQANEFYRICFRETRFSILDDYGHYDPIIEVKTPEMKITIDSLTPTIKITRTIDKNDFLINDIGTINVEVENEGEKKVYDLEYIDEIPYEFYIIEINGVTFSGNNVKWNWPSLVGTRTFSYKIKMWKPLNYSWPANLKYTFEDKEITKEVSSITVKNVPPENPLEIKRSLSSHNIKVGDYTIFKVTLTNIDPDNEVDIHAYNVKIPENFQVMKNEGFEKTKYFYTWSGKLYSGQTQTLSLKLKTDYTGSYEINSTLTNSFYNKIEKKTFTRTEDYSDKIKTDITKPEAKITFMFGKTKVEYDKESNIRAILINQDEKTPLFDIEFSVDSDLFDDYQGYITHIVPEQRLEAFYFPFTAPSLPRDTNYEIKFYGKYRTVFYEYFNFSATNKIIIQKDPNYVVQVEEEEETEQQEEQEAEQQETEQQGDTNTSEVEEAGEQKPEVVTKEDNFFIKFINALKKLISDIF